MYEYECLNVIYVQEFVKCLSVGVLVFALLAAAQLFRFYLPEARVSTVRYSLEILMTMRGCTLLSMQRTASEMASVWALTGLIRPPLYGSVEPAVVRDEA